VSWQATKTWKASNDPDFVEKIDRVLDLYDHPPAEGRVICVDEFGPLNLLPRAGCQTGTSRLKELPFPVAHRLLGRFRPPGRLGHGQLTSQDRQHDPSLLLGRNSRWFSHDSDSFTGQTRKQRALP
jgi:hypothetical protein